jgi:hypothetical protein
MLKRYGKDCKAGTEAISRSHAILLIEIVF